MTGHDEWHHATQPDHEAGRSGRQRDEPPELPRYHSDDAQVVIYSPKKPLAWISADPSSVVEVADDD